MNKLDNIIFKLIDKQVSECDTYIHNGGIWLIFTDKKQWAVELTSSGGLWYNYYFFNEIFGWVGVSDKINYYVEKWFQLRILNKEKVEDTISMCGKRVGRVENTIQNGVKLTLPEYIADSFDIEDTIQNGVKYTLNSMTPCVSSIEDTIQNGVKHTRSTSAGQRWLVEDTIQNGIKETIGTLRRTLLGVDDIIQNGVKHTKTRHNSIHPYVLDTIQNGVKYTRSEKTQFTSGVEDTIQNGVKCNLLQNNLESEIKIIS